jgi:hypothetical protein
MMTTTMTNAAITTNAATTNTPINLGCPNLHVLRGLRPFDFRRHQMKFPLSIIAAALGSTAVFAAPIAALSAQPVPAAGQNMTEPSAPPVGADIDNARWLHLIRGDDDDDDDDDDNCDHEDDDDDEDSEDRTDDCDGNALTAPQSGASAPPANGLFTPGTAPQVTSN